MRHRLQLLRIEPGDDSLHARVPRCARSEIRFGCNAAAKAPTGTVASKRFVSAAVERFAAVDRSPAPAQILIRSGALIRSGIATFPGILSDSRAEALHSGEIGGVAPARRRTVAHNPSSLRQNADRMLKRNLPHFQTEHFYDIIQFVNYAINHKQPEKVQRTEHTENTPASRQ